MTSHQVAKKLSLTRVEILVLVNLYPILRPAKIGRQGYIWSDAEFAALKAHIAGLKRTYAQVTLFFLVLFSQSELSLS